MKCSAFVVVIRLPPPPPKKDLHYPFNPLFRFLAIINNIQKWPCVNFEQLLVSGCT